MHVLVTMGRAPLDAIAVPPRHRASWMSMSMVDASLRMTIVNLFRTLRDRPGVSIIYITHDLATAYYVSDRIVTMRDSRIVEQGDARSVLSAPRHPYSILLKDSVLSVESAWADIATREG